MAMLDGNILQWILVRKPGSQGALGGGKFFCVQVQPRSWPRVHQSKKAMTLNNIVLPW